MVYAGDLKFPGRKAVRVRVPPDPPKYHLVEVVFCLG